MPEVPPTDSTPPADKRPESPPPERETPVERDSATTPSSGEAIGQAGPSIPEVPALDVPAPEVPTGDTAPPVDKRPASPPPERETPVERDSATTPNSDAVAHAGPFDPMASSTTSSPSPATEEPPASPSSPPDREEPAERTPASTPTSGDAITGTGPFETPESSTPTSPPATTSAPSEAPNNQQPTAPTSTPAPAPTPTPSTASTPAPTSTPTPTSAPTPTPAASPEQPLPQAMPVRMHTAPPAAEPRAPEAMGTTGVPHYSPPATTERLFGAPATVATPPKRSIFRPLGRGLREIAETIILALLIFLMVRAVVQNFQVEGSSMNPTFENEWYVLVNKSLYWEINLDTVSKFIPFVDPGDDPTRYLFRGPKRGDVIVFRSPTVPDNAPERDFIKRIIGMPGETVEVRDCTVFIDGLPLAEPYIKEKPRYTYGPETVPPDHYFVLGDNRNNSSDSHSWGHLPKENVIGQAWLIYWPRSAFGLVDNTSVTPKDPEPLPEPFQDIDPIFCPG